MTEKCADKIKHALRNDANWAQANKLMNSKAAANMHGIHWNALLECMIKAPEDKFDMNVLMEQLQKKDIRETMVYKMGTVFEYRNGDQIMRIMEKIRPELVNRGDRHIMACIEKVAKYDMHSIALYLLELPHRPPEYGVKDGFNRYATTVYHQALANAAAEGGEDMLEVISQHIPEFMQELEARKALDLLLDIQSDDGLELLFAKFPNLLEDNSVSTDQMMSKLSNRMHFYVKSPANVIKIVKNLKRLREEVEGYFDEDHKEIA